MKRIKRQNIIIVLLGLLTVVTSFSVGFASWTISGGDDKAASIDVDADNIEQKIIGVDCLSISSVSISYFTRHGFNVSYDQPLSYTGAKATIQFTLDIAALAETHNGERIIHSLSDTTSQSKMSVSVDFSAYRLVDEVKTPYSYNGVLSATAYTMSMVTKSTGITIARKSYTNGDSLSGLFNLSKVNLALTTVSIKSVITFSYVGSNYESFYADVVSGNFKFLTTLQAGEYEE